MAKTIHPVSVRLPEDLYQLVIDDAGKNERSISAQIVYLLRQAYQPVRAMQDNSAALYLEQHGIPTAEQGKAAAAKEGE